MNLFVGTRVQHAQMPEYAGQVVAKHQKAIVCGKSVTLFQVDWDQKNAIPMQWRDESTTGIRAGYLPKQLVALL